MLPLIIKPAIAALSAPLVDGCRRRHAAAAGMALGARRRSQCPLGADAVLRAGDRRRRVRPARRLSHRSLGRPRADLQHPALRASRRSRPGSSTSLEQLLVLRCRVRRRLRRVRRRGGLAGRAVPRTEAAREGARLHAGVLVGWRPAGRRRQRAAASIADQPAGHPRQARGLALHADLRRDPGAAADPHPAVPARVAGVGGKRGRPGARPSIAELFGPGLARRRRSSRRSSSRRATGSRSARSSSCRRSSARRTAATSILWGIAARRGSRPPRPRPRGRRRRPSRACVRSPATPPIRPSPPCRPGRRWADSPAAPSSRSIAAWAIARRCLLRIFQFPALIFVPLFFV